MWVVFAPAVCWSFVGTGPLRLAARPESRIGALMVAARLRVVPLLPRGRERAAGVHASRSSRAGCGARVFLHLGLSLPDGPAAPRLDRALVIAGYVIFPLAFVPALLFAGPPSSAAALPDNLLLIAASRTSRAC